MSSSAMPGTRDDVVRVIVSYAREDTRWLDPEYRFHLVPFLADSLRRQNVEFWIDRKLVIADEYRRMIESEIDRSDIALLIVSQSFLNSDFIENIELPRIEERARRGEMLVAPVLVEPCDWKEYPLLADRQMVPASNPLIDYTENDAKWAKVRFDILEGLKTQVKRIREGRLTPGQAPVRFVRPAESMSPPPIDPVPAPRVSVPASPPQTTEEKIATAAPAPAEPESFGIGLAASTEPSERSTTRKSVEWQAGGGTVARPRFFGIPAWVQVAAGTLAVLTISVSFGLYHSMGAHVGTAAPAPEPAVAPAAAAPNRNQTLGSRNGSEPSAPGSSAPEQDATPLSRTTARREPRPAPASSAQETSPALPRPSPAAFAALAAVMQTLHDQMSGIGSVSFTTSLRDTDNNTTWQNSNVDEVSNVSADPAQCRISYHWKTTFNGAVAQDSDVWLGFSRVQSIAVEPGEKHLTEIDAAAGHPNWFVYATTPPVTTVTITRTDGGYNALYLYTVGHAQSFARNLERAVQLCGGHASLSGAD